MAKTIQIGSRKLTYVFSCVVLFLLLMNLAVIYLSFVRGHEHLRGFFHGFYFDAEVNFPSLYSALTILLCSLLLWRIGSTRKEISDGHLLYWKFMSLVFAFLAIDEFASIHEHLIKPLKSLVEQTSFKSNYLYFAWFLPYGLFAVLTGFIFLKVLIKLPSRTRWLFIAGGLVFIAGAIGMEMVGGKYWAEQGWPVDGSKPVDLNYALIITVEEFLEMAGIIIFIRSLSEYYLSLEKEQAATVRFSDAGQHR